MNENATKHLIYAYRGNFRLTDAWNPLAPLLEDKKLVPEFIHALVILDGHMFAFSGEDLYHYTKNEFVGSEWINFGQGPCLDL